MVRRFDSPVGWEKEADDGKLVLYADYAALESKLETRTETLRQFADAVVRAPIDCDCMDCYKERREVRGRAEKMMEALDND